MSIAAWPWENPTVTAEAFEAAVKDSGFTIPPGPTFDAYHGLQNTFDLAASSLDSLPAYVDPRLELVPVEGGERAWTRPTAEENPLNAWSHKTVLKASKPTSQKLSGKTFCIKDNVSVAGAALGLGASPKLFKDGRHAVSTIDATIVRRILEASGTIVGTAVCEYLSLFPISLSAETGPVHNAWANGYTTGGSSSGCGSLVSVKDVQSWKEAGRHLPFPDFVGDEQGVDMAIGGDQGGSIRLPAAYSGIYGLKPTTGLVPYTGIVTVFPLLDTTGPMARSVEDVALLLQVIAGYDGIDFRQTPETPLRTHMPDYLEDLRSWQDQKEQSGSWTASSAARGLRVGVLKEAFEMNGLDPNVADLVRSAIQRYRDLGADVKEISVPLHMYGPAMYLVCGREAIPSFFENKAPHSLSHPLPGLEPRPIDQNFYDLVGHHNPSAVSAVISAAHLKAKYGPGLMRKCHMLIQQLRAAYDSALEDLDVLITPTTPTTGFAHPEDGSVLGLAKAASGITQNTCQFNLTGHPAMSMPCGWARTPDGAGHLPVGMQIVAKRWCEADIFKAAVAWEVRGKGMDSIHN